MLTRTELVSPGSWFLALPKNKGVIIETPRMRLAKKDIKSPQYAQRELADCPGKFCDDKLPADVVWFCRWGQLKLSEPTMSKVLSKKLHHGSGVNRSDFSV
ncbi:hypothetical protein Zmor_000496 [Zophobas morio]|uniref:Uncharacterized protein n=1 Tax=Zophobas morio TaxID=2755281 RepID=A0AA38J037_9CUCU|nr:hypothetical protein Zmor_000496 [Zophobas morio]